MTTAIEFQTKVEKASTNMDRLDAVVNGSDTTDVTTSGGVVPSIAKFLRTTRDIITAAPPQGWLTAFRNAGLSLNNKGDPGGNVLSIATFASASTLSVSTGTDLVQTSGQAAAGIGQAQYVYDASVDAAYVTANPRTAFRTTNGRGFRLAEPRPDVRQLGALGDGAADDTAAIQATLDYVESRGGGTVTLPAGEFKITSPLNLPPRTSLEGQGPFSVLRVYGCNGINIQASNGIGPRRVANLWLYGNGADAKAAIYSDLPYPSQAQGIVFEDLYISFFGTGARCRGLWHTAFRSVTMNQVFYGFQFVDRSIKVTIDDCRLTRGGLISGTGYSAGIVVGDTAFTNRPEDVQVDKTIVYGFDKAVVWRTALFGGVTNCDLDGCQKTGLELVTADGGFVFEHNYVQVDYDTSRTYPDDGTIYGVNAPNIGYTPNIAQNIVIANNRISCDSVKSGGMSYGIFLGSNQRNLSVRDNGVLGAWQAGLRADSLQRSIIADNKIVAGATVINTTAVAWRDNVVDGGLYLTNNTNFSTGATFGSVNTMLAGNVSMPAGQTTNTVTFASLGLPNLPDGTYGLSLAFNNAAGLSRGAIWGTATKTGITVNVTTPFGVAVGVDFTAKVY